MPLMLVPCASAIAGTALPCNSQRDWAVHGAAPCTLSVLVGISPTTFLIIAVQAGGVTAAAAGLPAPAAAVP